MIGKRAKREWNTDDYCMFKTKGNEVFGRIIELDGDVVLVDAKVKRYRVPIRLLHRLSDDQLDDMLKKDKSGPAANKDGGFSQYPVNWDPEKINFAFKAKGVRFQGFWRKRALKSHAIDVFAYAEGVPSVLADCISYGEDPRENMPSLNSDICAAVNKWLHFYEVKDSTTLEKLKQRADHPVVTVRRLGTIDKLILQLKEFRDTSIRCGGTRHFTFTSDEPTDPVVSIKVNFTDQAMALNGKIPNLYHGAVFDGVSGKRGTKGQKGDKLIMKPSQANVDALVDQLRAAKQRGDEVESRKIRSTLRKMGHKGGAKSVKAKE